MWRRYLVYLGRWQLSTPILAVCVAWFLWMGEIWATVIANFIGGLIFFWVDRFIFQSDKLEGPVWQVKHPTTCADCGNRVRGYRLVVAGDYDRRDDPEPEYRCEICSQRKVEELEGRGVRIL